MKQHMMERVSEASMKVSITAGATSAFWGWLTVERIFSLIGLLVAVGGMLISWHYKRKATAMREREAALREELLRARIEHLRMGATAAALQSDTDPGRLESLEDEA